MTKNNVFVKGNYELGYKVCKNGYMLVARSLYDSGKHFDNVLCWVENLPTEIKKEFKKGE